MFFTLFYQPILSILVALYSYIPGHDLAVSIILLTAIIKLILWPLSNKAVIAQKELQELQPKIEEIKKQYADNKEEQAKAMMSIYREHKINPFSSCLPVLIQLPFFFAIFRVLSQIASDSNILNSVYSFVARPEIINPMGFFGLVNLSKPNYVFAVMAGVAQFWQAKMLSNKRPPIKDAGAKDEDFAAIMNRQMLFMMPVMTVVIGVTLPSGLSLYWFTLTMLTILQQFVVFKKQKKN
ncbi:MAG: membrane protein insertase YidC [Peptococcaceae bacterium]|nr:membrane protein insertase YidC [Peptococcaceae bacterium]